MPLDVLLLTCAGTDPLTGQVYSALLALHEANGIGSDMAPRARPWPRNYTSTNLADALQPFPEPSAEAWQGETGRGQGWQQPAEVLSRNTQVMARLFAAQRWGT